MAEDRIEAEELPYITLLRKVPIKFVEWAEREVPTTYLMANCSNNPETYQQSVIMNKKADFYKALKQLKPKAKVKLQYEDIGACDLVPGMDPSTDVEINFQGKDIMSRGGIYERVVDSDAQFKKLTNIKNFLKTYQQFIEQNRGIVQKILKKEKISSPWLVFQKLMEDERLKVSFFSMIENQLGKENQTALLEKWGES